MKLNIKTTDVWAFVLIFAFTLIVSYFLTAGVVALICWLLPAIGIATIGGWTVAFSWKLALLIWIIWSILLGLFKNNKKGA